MTLDKIKRLLSKIMLYLTLSVAAMVAIFPFAWMFISTTNTSNDIAQGSLRIGTNLITNIRTLFSGYDVFGIFINSLKIGILTVVIDLVIASMAAFGFEKFKTKLSEKLYGVFLVAMMLPASALMIPLFKMISGMQLVNTHWAVIMPTMANTFLIFFFRQSFKSFSNDILEAARMDGASNIYAFFRIVVPTMRSTYAAATIYSFMTAWNSYLWPLLVLQTDDKKTMTLLLSSLSTASYVADYGMQMVALVLATIPMLVIFFIMQKSFVEGLTGSVKG